MVSSIKLVGKNDIVASCLAEFINPTQNAEDLPGV